VPVGCLVQSVLPKKNPSIRVRKHYLNVTARLAWEDLEASAGNSDVLAIISRLHLHDGNFAPGNDVSLNRRFRKSDAGEQGRRQETTNEPRGINRSHTLKG
jgi:hypothetical protein